MSTINDKYVASLTQNPEAQNDRPIYNNPSEQKKSKFGYTPAVKILPRAQREQTTSAIFSGNISNNSTDNKTPNINHNLSTHKKINASLTDESPIHFTSLISRSEIHQNAIFGDPSSPTISPPAQKPLKAQIKHSNPPAQPNSGNLPLLLNSLEKAVITRNNTGLNNILININKFFWQASISEKHKLKNLVSQLKISPTTHFKLLGSILLTCRRWEMGPQICQHVLSCLINAQQKIEALSMIVDNQHEFLDLALWEEIFKRNCSIGRNNPTAAKIELQQLVNKYWTWAIKSEDDFNQFQLLCKAHKIPFEHANPFAIKPPLVSTITSDYSLNSQIGQYVLKLENTEKENCPELDQVLSEIEKDIFEKTISQSTLECFCDANLLQKQASVQQAQKFETLIRNLKIDSNTPCTLLKVIADSCHFWQIHPVTCFTVLHALINSQKNTNKLAKILDKHQKFLSVILWHLIFKKVQEFGAKGNSHITTKSEIQLLLDKCWLRSIHSQEDFHQLQALCNHFAYTFEHKNPFEKVLAKNKTESQSQSDTHEIFSMNTFEEVFTFFKKQKQNLTLPNWSCLFDKLAELMHEKRLDLSQSHNILSILEFFTKSNAIIEGDLVGKLHRLFGKFSRKQDKLDNHATLSLNHLNYFLIDLANEYLPFLDSRAIYGVSRGLRSIKNGNEINILLKKMSKEVIKRKYINTQAYGGLIHTLGCHGHRAFYPIVAAMDFKESAILGLIETLHGFAEHAQKTHSTHRKSGLDSLELLMVELRGRKFTTEEYCLTFIHLAKCSYNDEDLSRYIESLLDDDSITPFLRLQIHFAFTTLGLTNSNIQQSAARLVEDAITTFEDDPFNSQLPSRPIHEKPTYACLAELQINRCKKGIVDLNHNSEIPPEDVKVNYTNSIKNNILLAYIAAFQLSDDPEGLVNYINMDKVHFIIKKIFSDKRLSKLDSRSLHMLLQAATLTNYPKEAFPKELLNLAQDTTTFSLTQTLVAERLNEILALQLKNISENQSNLIHSPVDIVIEGATINGKPVVIEVNGPCHRTTNTHKDLGKTQMKRRFLEKVYHVEKYHVVNSLDTENIEIFVDWLIYRFDLPPGSI